MAGKKINGGYQSRHVGLKPGDSYSADEGFILLAKDQANDIFNQMGYTCAVFDYRYNGESEGLPRGLIDWHQQQEDWKSAIIYTRQLENVDPDQVGLFGTSFSGGHVIQLAASDKRVKAVIIAAAPKLAALGLLDTLFGLDKRPITVPLTGKPGEAALMNDPDVLRTFPQLIPDGHLFQANIPARLVLRLLFLKPGSYASGVKAPILFSIYGKDSVAPARPTVAYAKPATRGVIKWYNVGHFEIYYGEAFERAMQDYKQFIQECLPV
ncbi:Alpha/Beta hydrolase protein [Aspergillus pseudoustus]|uniref:Alpha/Beta hydrolase protein n=1 Tax=Aspergillus pseudoustus TaxID=1810923 RepID=A0ABR4K308_9EURO